MTEKFAQFWYPDFIGIAYAEKNGNLLVCPYFDNLGKANHVLSKIRNWNPNFTRVRFIEYNRDDYAIVIYENPKASYEKINFGLYRSHMRQEPNYLKYKNRILKGNCRLLLLFSKDPTNISKFKSVGESLRIKDCKIINESELESTDYSIERWAHETCKGN